MNWIDGIDLILKGKTPSQRAMIATDLIPLIREHLRLTREFARPPRIECVYFIQDRDGLVKIGWSRNLRERIAALQTASAEPIRLIAVVDGSRNIEQWLHRMLREDRVRGEWFRPSAALDAYLMGEGFIP